MVTESHLVVPDPEWAIEQSWDTEAEQVHGITLEQLRRDGAPAFNVARRMNEVLWHRDLFSDSPRDRAFGLPKGIKQFLWRLLRQ